jgi:hypothetical protein
MRHYCTYFDRRYLPRGLALFHSLQTQAHAFCLHVLCLDDTCYDILVRANFEQLKPIRLPDLEAYDAELASARGRRTLVEYYFTLTPALPLFLFDSDPDITLITYLDSDLFFFGNPEEIFEEMGSASVLIVGHRFPPAGKFREINGIYNVSLISWRSDKEGRACLEWFRERTLEWCCDVVEETRFADQKYLDDWPVRFSGVHVLQHKGCNVAPFNFENYHLSWRDDRFFVDEAPIIFYHFHGLSNWYKLSFDQTGISEYLTSPNSDLALLLEKVYAPYIETLCRARDEAERLEIEPLASGATILVLDDIRTLSGTDTLVAMRRPAGSAIVVEREYVWFDPVRLSYIPELADCRIFVLPCPKKPKTPLRQRLRLLMRSVWFRR